VGASQTKISPQQTPLDPNESNGVVPSDVKQPKGKGAGEKPSRIELLLSRPALAEANDVSLDLKQFGYDVFSKPITTFSPMPNVLVGSDYVIGPGDSFSLRLWGRVDAQYALLVDRNGQIILPEVGAPRVWGMTFGDLHGYLDRAELPRREMDPNAVYYRERINVDPKRVLAGDERCKIRLQDDDHLSVLPIPGWRLNEPHVSIGGLVHDPNEYRLFGGMRVRDPPDLAGGLQKNAYLRSAEIARRHISQDGVTTEKINVDLEKAVACSPECWPYELWQG
jgi:protein involved in polysaccharide export with SLBB domain